jgi:hypothetical protein
MFPNIRFSLFDRPRDLILKGKKKKNGTRRMPWKQWLNNHADISWHLILPWLRREQETWGRQKSERTEWGGWYG